MDSKDLLRSLTVDEQNDLEYMCDIHVALGKTGYQTIFFFFLQENICCGYSLKVPNIEELLTSTHNMF